MREDGITHAVESVGLARAVLRRRSSIERCDPVVVLSHCCIEGELSLGRSRRQLLFTAKCGPTSGRDAPDKKKIACLYLAWNTLHPTLGIWEMRTRDRKMSIIFFVVI
jgi:hypothetical protein